MVDITKECSHSYYLIITYTQLTVARPLFLLPAALRILSDTYL